MTHSQWHFICSPAVWFLPSGTLSIPAVWFFDSGTLFVFPLYDSFPVALYGPNLTQNIRHTSFFLVLQKVLRETETAVTRLLGREFLLKFRQIPWWIYDGVYISSKLHLSVDQEPYQKRILSQVSIKSFAFILRVQIKILNIFWASLNNCSSV